jgi:hypothetical protein
MTTFRIATFVNDEAQYAEMRSSFEESGFVAPVAVYERLNDKDTEPYEAITRLGWAEEPYVLLVHQDVRSDEGSTAAGLATTLADLTGIDPRWAVAGNAGVARPAELIRHLRDPWGEDWRNDLPRQVDSVDEDLIILRTAQRPACSEDLRGFHLYGPDVCAVARGRNHWAYVIDFRVSHFGAGDAHTASDTSRAVTEFGISWGRRRVLPAYAHATWTCVTVARWEWLRRMMSRRPVCERLATRLLL